MRLDFWGCESPDDSLGLMFFFGVADYDSLASDLQGLVFIMFPADSAGGEGFRDCTRGLGFGRGR